MNDEERKRKPLWWRVKTCLQKAMESRGIKKYKDKKKQSQFYQEHVHECHLWLSQNLHGRMTSSIMTMLEQMVENRSWKAATGLVYPKRMLDAMPWQSEYLSRHNRAPMIMTFAWAKEYKLIGGDMVWYKERWERGMVLESKREKLVWDFKFHLYKATTVRRPYLTLEDKAQERIWICNMACHQQ